MRPAHSTLPRKPKRPARLLALLTTLLTLLTSAASTVAAGAQPSRVETLERQLEEARELEIDLRENLDQANVEYRSEIVAMEAELESGLAAAEAREKALAERIALLETLLADAGIEVDPSGDATSPESDPGEGTTAVAAVEEPLVGPAPTVISAVVGRWESAWEERRPEKYFSYYSSDFVPEGESRARWEAAQRERMETAEYIRIELQSLVVTVDGRRATASFLQSYESDVHTDSVVKLLDLADEDGVWRIVRQRGF